jgi:hypothetical protein
MAGFFMRGRMGGMHAHRLYFLSIMLFLACAGTAFAALITLLIGLSRMGFGHGEATTWYVGLVIACVAWLLLFFSCAFGVLGYRRSSNRWPPVWLVIDWMILIAATAVGVWGNQG